MYEMEGPRPVSRHRPADFSASFAPLDHLPGPGTLPVLRSTGSPGGSGLPAPWLKDSPLCQQTGVAPKPGGAKYCPRQWLRAFFYQLTGVSPSQKAQVFPSPWLRAFFSLRDSEFPLRHIT